MKRLLEFKIYDILKDADNEKFLNKVKKENPDLYSKFLNLVGNKGLKIAKEKYVEYDPETIKKREEEEKAERARLKQIGRKKDKEERESIILKKYEKEIREIKYILNTPDLQLISNKIKSNSVLSKLLKGCKKQYESTFKKMISNPIKLNLYGDVKIDTLKYNTISWWYEKTSHSFLTIIRYYNLRDKKISYSLKFNFPFDYTLGVVAKESEFLTSRNKYIENLNGYELDEKELNERLFKKLPYVLSEEVREKWMEEYELRQTSNKYNL